MAKGPEALDENRRMTLTIETRKASWAEMYFAMCKVLLWCAAPVLSEPRLDGMANRIARFYANYAIQYRLGEKGKWRRLRMTGDETDPRLKLDCG